jgi:hypothetical protein
VSEEPARVLRERYAPLLDARAADGLDGLSDTRIVAVPGDVPPWTDTGLHLEAGDRLSVLAEGRVVLSEELGLWFGPRVYLWRRIGVGGPVFRAARETATHRAPHAGRFALGIYPGAWTTPAGDYEAATPFAGGFAALLLRWRSDPRRGLAAVDALLSGDPLVRSELERLDTPIAKPEGWEPLWYVGDTDVFEAVRLDGRAVIRARVSNDAGILKRPVSAPLTPCTRLRWAWRFHELPSRVAENQLHTHDYLSLAVEFENGQDLTYTWSAALPEGTTYRCPLPWWDQRETHAVIRTGRSALGAWHAEERRPYEDYRAAIGEPPARIVGVWLIAVSLFGHGRGEADFADIVVDDGSTRLEVS